MKCGDGVAVLMALRQLRKHCLAVNAANAQPVPVPAAATRDAERQAAVLASVQHRATLSAYYNVMHAVGAASEVYRGGNVVLRSVVC